jgi:hypothetical protein
MKTSPFFKQADLVVQLIPFVNAETCFALKGGTAIWLQSPVLPRPRQAYETHLRPGSTTVSENGARVR